MALAATIYHFAIQLSNVDRGVYESLALKVARHPSEAEDYLLARVLAYCLEFTEGLSFSRGLADPDEPALAVRDLTGRLLAWIDIGAPDAARLHKAAKAAPRVAVYTHRDIRNVLGLAREYGLDLVLIGATEGWMVADEIAQARVPVVLKVLLHHLVADVARAPRPVADGPEVATPVPLP